MWRWDGQRWVPTSAQPYAAPRRSTSWIWWVVGGCGVLVLLAIGGAVVGGVALVNSFIHGSLTCMPSDFPVYPAATVTREYTYVGTNVPAGDTRECQMTFVSNDSPSAVNDFYTSKLSAQDWAIASQGGGGCTNCSPDQSTTEIKFQRRSRSASAGVIDIVRTGQQTEIKVRFDS